MDNFPLADMPRMRSEYSVTPAVRGGTGLRSFAVSTLLYASAANVWSALATGNSGVLITNSSGVPSISASLPSVTLGSGSTATTQSASDNSTKVATTAYTDAQAKYAVRYQADPNAAAPAADPTATDRPHSLMNQIYSQGFSAGAQFANVRSSL